MDSPRTTYATFPFEWTVKATSCQIRYRKTFNINETDEIFCSIINAKGNEIEFAELGNLLGFYLQDLAEIDIFKYYLKGLNEYNLIEVNEKEQIIQLTEFGQEAIQSKLKYKYYFATTELFENQTATDETFDFSFKNVFDIENSLSHLRETKEYKLGNPEVKKKLQFQLFENNIFKGEIVELYEDEPRISYKTISLQAEIIALDNSFELSIFKSIANKPEVQFLIDLPVNKELKRELHRKGMYHHILAENTSISKQDIETYKDLWNWKELAKNPKVDWSDKTIFDLFRENGDGGIWSIISEKAPIESIKSVIEKYADYWNWTTLTERFDDNYIKEQIENFDWDFEELSYKETDLLTFLLSNLSLKDKDWDWYYLSKNLPNDFIEKHIDDFNWDFYLITEVKSDILRNLFKNQGKSNYTNILLSKPWNWKFISKKFKDNFLYEQIHFFARKIDWNIVLERFFTSEEITSKCLKDKSFKALLKQHLPENFVIAHQRYLWTPELIDFFENQNLIQWETQKYIIGFDTNENVEWSKPIFKKYYDRIITEDGFLNISKQISDYSLIYEFPDFAWNWEGISQNKKLISNSTFIEKAFIGELSFSNNLLWDEILTQSTIDISFWNNNLEAFYKATESEKQTQFWKTLSQKESTDFVFENKHFPWDWSFITENSSIEIILDSFEDDGIFQKWDWKLATRQIDKETILENLEILTKFIDWKYAINEIFNDEIVFDNSNLNIAYRLSQLEPESQIEIWKILTAKYPFEKIFPLIEKNINFDIWKWDWEYISYHPHLPNDFKTLDLIKHKIIWEKFSDNESIKRKFEYNKSEWSYNEYFKYVLKYLKAFQNFWDWKVLTQNSNLHYNREFIKIFQDKWNWEYLSEKGGFILQKKRDNENYLLTLLLEFQQIHFPILSKRKDIEMKSDLILETKDRDWDWQVLSENEKAEISNLLILELKNKNWNWQTLSRRKNIEFSNETLLQLLDKDWDWHNLSENANLEFNAEFIEKTKVKSWNWKLVSRHKSFSPSVEILTLTKDYELDWEYLSQHSSLNPTIELLAKFEYKWNWRSITENPQIKFDDIDFLERFADKWNWRFICESGKLTFNIQILNKFKEYLDWNVISSNTNLYFTREIIQEFKLYWNWSRLKENKRIEELLGSYISDEINKNATLSFIDKIEQQWSDWKGNIYHFSHIDNAVEIIKNRSIQSRNKANIKGDSAGNVVHRRGDAHDYARFYFRPQTPTQFYNEFLGKDQSDFFFEKARNLGFPKCPIPIFFKFPLKDVLFKNEKKCCVSNGNMQKNATQFKSVDQMIDKFNFQYLYSDIGDGLENYMNYSQQEFLIMNELSFKKGELNDFEIVCPSEADRTLLIKLLGNEHKDIFSKIVIDSSYYNNENPRVRIEEEENELHIVSEFKGNGYFVLNGANVSDIEILKGDLNKIEKDKIIFKSFVSLRNLKQNIQLNFIDESNRSWFVYSKKLNDNYFTECKEVNYWNNLKYNLKKEIFLNYLLSLNNVQLRKSAFLDDSYSLEFILCKILKMEFDLPESDLNNFDNWVKGKISNLTENEIRALFYIEEIILQGLNSLKLLEFFPKLRLVYLDHCIIEDINSLTNLNHLSFYESPGYPTNIPSLNKNPEYFLEQVNIITNPTEYIQNYFK
jgi:hypothetical protein